MKSGLILFLFFSFSFVQAQSIRCRTSLLAFDTLLETQTDSLSFFLSNVSQQGITVNQFYLMPIYGAPAFFLKDSLFLVPALDSVRVWVYFKPRHNIYHNSELIMTFCPTGQCLAGTHRINLTGQGRYSNTYYQTTENLIEQSLRTALKTKISSPFTSLGYNSARDQMFMLIDNKATNGQGATVNTLECIYTGRVITGYTSRTQAQNSPMNFNTEHTFPQGFFNENEPMRSDLFHLFPTDAPANNSRANFAFGIASTPFQSVAINNPLNLADASKLGANNLYEPRNLQKGRTARGMMYFVLRYQDYSNFMSGQESLLRTWHSLYPPLTEERTRNQAIALQQQNRNPFIDYPQFAERISSLTAATTSAPVVWGIRPALNSIHLGPVGVDSLYRYVFHLTNTGNQAIQISNPTISGAGLAITSGSSGFTIAIGESAPVSLSFTQSGNLSPSGTLSFQTNVPGFGSVNIPITGANQLSLEQTEFRFVAPELFPLPADEEVYIGFKEKRYQPLFIRLINERGQVVFDHIEAPNAESFIIETRHLPEGLYFLGLAYGSFHQFYKVPVRH
jgi:endonuclease I